MPETEIVDIEENKYRGPWGAIVPAIFEGLLIHELMTPPGLLIIIPAIVLALNAHSFSPIFWGYCIFALFSCGRHYERFQPPTEQKE